MRAILPALALLLAGCGLAGSPAAPTATVAGPTSPPPTATVAVQAKAPPTSPPTAAPTVAPTQPAPTPTPPPPTRAPAATPTAVRPPPTATAAPSRGAAAGSSGAACRPGGAAVAPQPGHSVRVDRGPSDCNVVALTFDAGADRGYAEQMLDTLKQQRVPASFGMTGQWAERNQDLVKRMAAEGHQLINHTWSHRSFTGYSAGGRPLSLTERQVELQRTEELLQSIGGRPTKPHFRPPYGDLDEGVLRDVAAAGYAYTIMWTVDSFGWNKLPARGIVERCLSRAAPGAIYLFHVGAESQDAQALLPIIDGLRARGYGFVTVEELLRL